MQDKQDHIDHLTAMREIMTQQAINYIEKQQGSAILSRGAEKPQHNDGQHMTFIGCTFNDIVGLQKNEIAS